jgi:flagellar motor switch protein FliN
MTTAHDVLSQLLSPVQADVLQDAAANAWANGAAALAAVLGQEPGVSATDARLMMPDELATEFTEPHIALSLAVSPEEDQGALAYVVVPTAAAAVFFDSTAADPEDQQRQTMVVVSTVVGQLLQAINGTTFADSPTGLVLSVDDIVAGGMESALHEMDEPCLYVSLTLEVGRPLPVALVLGGAFLDILSAGVDTFALGAATMPADSGDAFEPAVVRSDAFAEMPGAPGPAPAGTERAPTPISAAPKAQRAQFGPISEPLLPPPPSNIDLLADLQMRVSVELGRTRMSVSDVLSLGAGSVVELDRLAGEPVDILVNDRIVARGEVVVVDENFGVRVVEVLARSRDLRKAL